MKEKAANFLKGFGSILNGYPDVRCFDTPNTKLTAEQRLQQSWDYVKQAFEKAMGDFEIEINEKQNRKSR